MTNWCGGSSWDEVGRKTHQSRHVRLGDSICMGKSREGLGRTKKFIMGRDQPAQKGVVRARTETLAGYNHQKSCTACLISHGWGVMGSI